MSLVIIGWVSLGGAILVSLIVSGELPWFTTGWRHFIAEIVLFVVFIGGLIGFFVWEERRYRAKRE